MTVIMAVVVTVLVVGAVLSLMYFQPALKMLATGKQLFAVANGFSPGIGVTGSDSVQGRWTRTSAFLRTVWIALKGAANKFVFLQSYGDSLLDPSSKLYLTLYGTAILLMALLEGIAWGCLGWAIGGAGILQWLAAGFASFVVGGLVLGMDLLFAFHDRLDAQLSAEFGVPSSQHGPGLVGGLLIRIVLVAGSLAVAAPLLTQATFRDVIKADRNAQAAAAIESKRLSITQKYESEIKRIENEIARLNLALNREVAGERSRGGRGFGPVAKDLKRQIDAATQKLQAEVTGEHIELESFNADAAKWNSDQDTLQTKWNVAVPAVGVLVDREEQQRLEQRSDYRQKEWSIRFIFILAFGSVVMAKFCESHAVALYRSSLLQSMYADLKPIGNPHAKTFYREMQSAEHRARWAALADMKSREPNLKNAVDGHQRTVDSCCISYERALGTLEKKKPQIEVKRQKLEWDIAELANFAPEHQSPIHRHAVQAELQQQVLTGRSELMTLEADAAPDVRDVERARVEYEDAKKALGEANAQLFDLRRKISEVEMSLTSESARVLTRRWAA
jgi:hypothetical protein